MFDNNKKTLFSGIQPSGIITLGNYIGALKNFVDLQNDYNCIFSVVDLHAITTRQNPEELFENSLKLTAMYIACGLDIDKCILFIQSHVPAHSELAWILNTFCYIGEASRMTQFKEKSKKNTDNINLGLMAYPVLQAADILLYKSDVVPIGADQKQHLELARNIAIRFNGIYGETFKVPDPIIPKSGAKIMSLSEPDKKMSKSDENEFSYISLTDDADTIIKKFKRSVTDSDNKIIFSNDKPGISNLLTIYSVCKNIKIKDAEKEFANANYGTLKSVVAESVIEKLAPIQSRYKKLLDDKQYLQKNILDSKEKANLLAIKTLDEVSRKIGFLRF